MGMKGKIYELKGSWGSALSKTFYSLLVFLNALLFLLLLPIYIIIKFLFKKEIKILTFGISMEDIKERYQEVYEEKINKRTGGLK